MSELVFDTRAFQDALRNSALEPWSDALGQAVLAQGHALKHGHLPKWENAVASLPTVADTQLTIDNGRVRITGSFKEEDQAVLQQALVGLMPWRKGPFSIGPLFIDTEWRSDWKWDRIETHIADLEGRTVLDVGCGSGYHLWRMRDAGAVQVLGIDPSLLYLMQFNAIQQFASDQTVQFLPLPMEALPESMTAFDTVFSMGVLYHRRDPAQHLSQLKHALKSEGELVLETLVVPDEGDTSLLIEDRYANMRNIYQLPSVERLEKWIAAQGFQDVQTVSVEQTSRKEQRTSEWMPSHSLAQAIHPDNAALTIEGHPRPLRAVVIANKG